jgi:hypothetical protein
MAISQGTLSPLIQHFAFNANRIGQRLGPQTGLDYLFFQMTPSGMAAFLSLFGYSRITALRAASASDAAQIIRDPWVLAASKSNTDAIFLYGPGFTPDVYDYVVRVINQLPGTRGSRIDLVNTGRLAGLSSGLLYVLSAIENPGRAGAAALGVSPNTVGIDISNPFARQLYGSLPPNLFPANSGQYQVTALQRFLGPNFQPIS